MHLGGKVWPRTNTVSLLEEAAYTLGDQPTGF